jgi:hypothetical protein
MPSSRTLTERETHLLHEVASPQARILFPTQTHLLVPAAIRVAVTQRYLLESAVLERGTGGLGFSEGVRVEDVEELLLVGLRGCFHGGEGGVG